MATKLVSLEDARLEYLGGLSKVKLFDLINQGELERVKIGRRSFITDVSLNAFIDRISGAA